MILRPYRPSDLRELAELFYDTVHTVNAGDYTAEQLDAWADGAPDLEEWGRTLLAHTALVAVEAERIVTHASITARPFFEKRGYRTLRERRVLRYGVPLTNYHMEKRRFPAAQNACYSAENAVAPQAETE